MKIMEGCLPCLLRQAGEAAKRVNASAKQEEKILSDTKAILEKYKEYENAPHLAQAIHNCVLLHTKSSDPYREKKESDLAAAKSLIPILKDFIESFDDRLYAALKVSAVGNNLDSAVEGNMDIKVCINAEPATPFTLCDSEISEKFKEVLSSADIVISKGQGNFESLSEIKGIFFLLKAKCPVIAERFGVKAGSYIFIYNR